MKNYSLKPCFQWQDIGNNLSYHTQESDGVKCGTSAKWSTTQLSKKKGALYELTWSDFQDILLSEKCSVKKEYVIYTLYKKKEERGKYMSMYSRVQKCRNDKLESCVIDCLHGFCRNEKCRKKGGPQYFLQNFHLLYRINFLHSSHI